MMIHELTQSLDYNSPSPSQLGLLNCIWAVGSLVALPAVPYTADMLGRRTGVMIGCSIMIGGVALQSLGFTFGMFVSARFFIGFGVAIAHGSSPLLITELVHPQHRAIYTAIYNTTWYIGSFIAAWLTFGKHRVGQTLDECKLIQGQVPTKSNRIGHGERRRLFRHFHRSCR